MESSVIDDLDRIVETFEGEQCPACAQPLTKDLLQKHLRKDCPQTVIVAADRPLLVLRDSECKGPDVLRTKLREYAA